MASQHILRLRRIDQDDFVLLNVIATGPKTLDLRLEGSDGERPFGGALKHADVRKLRASNFDAPAKEWETILSNLFLQHQTLKADAGKDIEAVASVDADSMTVAICRNVGGITQRLGEVKLECNEEYISFYDWVAAAVERGDALQAKAHDLQSSMTAQQRTIEQLNAQLEDLIRAKKSHEEELMSKFVALLNEKKLKIRDQQRLLANAKIDPTTAAQVRQMRSGSRHKPETSGTGKRKANDDAPAVSSDDDEPEPARSRMETDDGSGDEAEQMTPEGTDTEDAADDDSDAEAFNPAPSQSQPPNAGTRQTEKSPDTSKSDEMISKPEHVAKLVHPPRRELPFASKVKAPAPVPPVKSPAAHDSEGEDETDDEL